MRLRVVARTSAPIVMVAVVAFLEIFGMSPAGAQSASQITPHSFAPAIQGSPDQAGFSIGELSSLDTPQGADTLFVTLSGVELEHEPPQLTRVGQQIRARVVGHRLSGAEIFKAVRDLEVAYSRAGYVLERVVLPPQDLVDGGNLHIIVIDGYIEAIDTRRVSPQVRRRIQRLVNPLIGRRTLTLRQIERQVLLAGDVPGVILRSTLAPGSETGAAVLVLEARYQSIDSTLSADNSLSRALGSHEVGVGLDLNSVFGHGETAYARVNGDPLGGTNGFVGSLPRNRSLATGFIVPVGTAGMTLNLEGTQARTTPTADNDTQSADVFDRLSIRMRHPWIRSRNFNLASQLVLDSENEHETLVVPTTLPLFDDRLRVLRVIQDWNGINAGGGGYSGSLTVSRGIDALGARSAARATPALPLSRQGAQANFTKLETSLDYSQGLAEHLNASVTARGQYAFGGSLARAEEFGIADPDSLSAFDAGSLQGDSGYVLRAEVSSPWPIPIESRKAGILAAPYGFAATGRVYASDPTSLEPRQISGGSYGAGLRIGAGAAGSLSTASLNLELARESAGDTRDLTRLHLSVSFKF